MAASRRPAVSRTGRWRWPAFAAALTTLGAAAIVGCGPAPTAQGPCQGATVAPALRVITPTPRARSVSLPGVTGTGGIRAAWQGAPVAFLTISGSLLLGVTGELCAEQLHAINAATGRPVWTVSLHGTTSPVLGLVPAGRVVVVEFGRHRSLGPLVTSAVFEYVALDLATGRERWAEPVSGGYEFSPIAAAGNLLLTANPAGTVTARNAGTSALAWRQPRPSGCSLPAAGRLPTPSVQLAANGGLIVASFECGAGTIVQRLSSASGAPTWTWRSPAGTANDPTVLTVTAAASQPGIVLLTGGMGHGPAAALFAAKLPHSYRWPQQLGLDGGASTEPTGSTVLVLSAKDGSPLWSESGGQQETFALTAGAVCEVVIAGLECRDDLTGAPTMPDLLTGHSGGLPPYNGDGLAAVSGGYAAVTVGPFNSDHVRLRIVDIRSGAVVAQASLAIRASNLSGSNYGVFPVAADVLPGGTMVVLVRRIDIGGYPVLALSLARR